MIQIPGLEVRSTQSVINDGFKCLIYGKSGVGKTRLLSTLPYPFIIASEYGLKTLREFNLPYVQVKTMGELNSVYNWLKTSHQAQNFQSVALDSLSETLEILLADEMKKTSNGQKAYGEMAKKGTEMIRDFMALPRKHVIFTCKEARDKDDSGGMLFTPSVPGNKFPQDVPYFFDELWRLEVQTDPTTKIDTRILRCQANYTSTAKSRIGLPSEIPQPNLGAIFNHVMGH